MTMEEPLGFVVEEVSSESKEYPASGLTDDNSSSPWTSAAAGLAEIYLVLKFDKSAKISRIVVRNNFSGLLEVFGQETPSKMSAWNSIVSKSSLMTPADSRNETNGDAERELKINPDGENKSFGAIKFVCQQPFNKKLSYGLSKVCVYGRTDAQNGSLKPRDITLKKKATNNDIKPGDLFSAAPKTDVTAASMRKKDSGAVEETSSTAKTEEEDSPPTTEVAASQTGQSSDKVAALSRPLQMKKRAQSAVADDDDEPSTSRGKRGKKTEDKADFVKKSRSGGSRKTKSKKKDVDSDDEEVSRKTSRKRRKSSSGRKSKKSSRQKSDRKKKDSDVDADETAMPKKSRRSKSGGGDTKDILKGVIIALSGFVNPERTELREKALEMGAKYRSDWTDDCTHLICAFANTPKYTEVQTAGGKIMKKEWLDACLAAKRILPWRSYMLKPTKSDADDEDLADEMEEAKEAEEDDWDPDASSSESEAESSESEEVMSEELESDGSEVDEDEISGVEDDELEEDEGSDASAKKKKAPVKKASPKKRSPAKKGKRKGIHFDSDSEDSTELNLTDASEADKDEKELPPRQLKLLQGKHFYLYGALDKIEEERIRKTVIKLGGSTREYNDEKVTHCVTNLPWSEEFDTAMSDNPRLTIVTPAWVYEADKIRSVPDPKQFRPK